MINMVYLYYDNPRMLRMQIDCWNAYCGALECPPEVLLVDDGSPKTAALDIVKAYPCALPIRVFRINEDIAWNFAGARNLGCTQATDWIYVSDIDTLLMAADARVFFAAPLDPKCFYMPRRISLPSMEEARPALVNLLYHKEIYQAMGGYDEDYAGHYGREETDFYRRIQRFAKKRYREDAVVRVVPLRLVRDACTRTERPRDKTRNAELFARKQAAGFPRPERPLRFTWQRVL